MIPCRRWATHHCYFLLTLTDFIMSVATVTLSDGHVMPMVGFGTYLCSDEEAQRVVAEAVRAGYRHVDTAEYYANEKGVGDGIRYYRMQYVLVT